MGGGHRPAAATAAMWVGIEIGRGEWRMREGRGEVDR